MLHGEHEAPLFAPQHLFDFAEVSVIRQIQQPAQETFHNYSPSGDSG